MGVLRYVLYIVVLVSLCHCGVNQTFDQSVTKTFQTSKIEGVVQRQDRSEIELSDLDQDPIILMFSAMICSACDVEVNTLYELLPEQNDEKLLPENVSLISVLVNKVKDEDRRFKIASDWKNGKRKPWRGKTLPWDVGIVDPENNLFEKYCGGGQTPCTVIYIPGKPIDVHVGFDVKDPQKEWQKTINKVGGFDF